MSITAKNGLSQSKAPKNWTQVSHISDKCSPIAHKMWYVSNQLYSQTSTVKLKQVPQAIKINRIIYYRFFTSTHSALAVTINITPTKSQ